MNNLPLNNKQLILRKNFYETENINSLLTVYMFKNNIIVRQHGFVCVSLS
jgi:hypothetical protein